MEEHIADMSTWWRSATTMFNYGLTCVWTNKGPSNYHISIEYDHRSGKHTTAQIVENLALYWKRKGTQHQQLTSKREKKTTRKTIYCTQPMNDRWLIKIGIHHPMTPTASINFGRVQWQWYQTNNVESTKGFFTPWTVKLSQGLVKNGIGCSTHHGITSVYTKQKMFEWPWSS